MDLRVMSPTSYQTALPRVVVALAFRFSLFNIADKSDFEPPILI